MQRKAAGVIQARNLIAYAAAIMPFMTQLTTQSDEQLMASIVRGDEDAFAHLYDRYSPKVMGFLYKFVHDQGVAAEVLQELFIRLWDRRDQYDPTRARFTTWMFGIARNMAIDRLRRMNRRPGLIESEAEERQLEQQPTGDPNVSDRVDDRLRADRLRAAINELPAEQRLVIEQAYFGGLTRQEIARENDIPLGTVHSRARLGLQRLGRLLEDLQGDHG